jgi:His/Glu/Gln/Arg/opine family amino acid ABC transporter permease subunit
VNANSRLAEFALPLIYSAGVTIIVSLGALIVALTIGILFATLRFMVANRFLQRTIQGYVEIFRNIPSLTHLFILFYGLAYLGIRMSSIAAAIVGLGLIGAASLSEVFRAGFESVHRGQREAALAVGLRPFQAFQFTVFPQALRVALPSIGNYAVQLIKDTSLVAAIAAPEIMFTARNLVVNTFQTTLVYALAAALYVVLCLPLSRIIRSLEKRVAAPR